MSDINSVCLVGRLTKDVASKQVGERFVNEIDLAVNGWKNKQVLTSFFNVCYWSKTDISKYLVKGKQIMVSGELEQHRWIDRNDGKNRSQIIINAQQIVFGSDTNKNSIHKEDTDNTEY
jgi:single-strand DNA-binding protein